MAKIKTVTNNNKLFIFVIQDENGKIQKILTGDNYENLWFQGVAESKAQRGFWEMRDLSGRFIDGNYRSKVVR